MAKNSGNMARNEVYTTTESFGFMNLGRLRFRLWSNNCKPTEKLFPVTTLIDWNIMIDKQTDYDRLKDKQMDVALQHCLESFLEANKHQHLMRLWLRYPIWLEYSELIGSKWTVNFLVYTFMQICILLLLSKTWLTCSSLVDYIYVS